MKKFAFALVATFSFFAIGMTGCGGSTETQVIEAPAATDDASMEGFSEEDYAAGMQESMGQQGN